MEFELDIDQRQLVDAVTTLLRRYDEGGGRSVSADPAYDHGLERRLDEAGFLDVAGAGGSPLDAVLVTEQVARSTTVLPVGWRCLLAPLVGDVPWPWVPVTRPSGQVVRFASDARAVVVVEPHAVRVVDAASCVVEPLGADWGYPVARVSAPGGSTPLAVDPQAVLAAWRLAIAAEIVGAAGAAFDLTVEYAKDRRQFGRPIGSFQAVQHRLATLAVVLEGARFATYEAAWRVGDGTLAAVAATRATTLADLAFVECQQLHGAIGLTKEYVLHRWTLRLRALGVELGGGHDHARAVAALRYQL